MFGASPKKCRLARMSDGRYCLVRDLGPVKGGGGMRQTLSRCQPANDCRGRVGLFRCHRHHCPTVNARPTDDAEVAHDAEEAPFREFGALREEPRQVLVTQIPRAESGRQAARQPRR